MKNLSTLTNVKSVSNKSASKIKGGEYIKDVVVDNFIKTPVVVDNFSTNTTSCNTYKVTIK